MALYMMHECNWWQLTAVSHSPCQLRLVVTQCDEEVSRSYCQLRVVVTQCDEVSRSGQ